MEREMPSWLIGFKSESGDSEFPSDYYPIEIVSWRITLLYKALSISNLLELRTYNSCRGSGSTWRGSW